MSDIFPPPGGPDVSAYGKPAFSPNTHIPVKYQNIPGGWKGQYDPGMAFGHSMPILQTLLPRLAAAIGPSITIDPSQVKNQADFNSLMGHEETHGFSTLTGVQDNSLPSYPVIQNRLVNTRATENDKGPSEGMAQSVGGSIFTAPETEQIQKDVLGKLPQQYKGIFSNIVKEGQNK